MQNSSFAVFPVGGIIFPAFFSVLFLSGPFEEEFGWRGYALPRLQARFSALMSSLILGVIWAAWHIPQFLVPGNGMFYQTPFWTFVLTVVAATVLFTWVYNNVNGSLLAMLLLHTTFNLSMFVFPVLDTSMGYVYELGLFSVSATLVTGFSGWRRLRHENGTIKWFNQVLPHDILDHDLQIAPILASANVNGVQQDIVIGAGKMGRVYAFNRDTGALLWQTAVGEHQNDTFTVLPSGTTRVLPGILGGVETPMAYSVSDKILYVPVVDVFTDFTPTSIDASTIDFIKGKGELVAISVNTGNILWSKVFESANYGAATVVNDVVFTATYDGTIYGYRTTTGEQLFNYSAPAGINGWPAVAGNMIVWPAGVGADASVIVLRTTPKGGGGIPIEYIAGIAIVIVVVVIAVIALATRKRKTKEQ